MYFCSNIYYHQRLCDLLSKLVTCVYIHAVDWHKQNRAASTVPKALLYPLYSYDFENERIPIRQYDTDNLANYMHVLMR